MLNCIAGLLFKKKGLKANMPVRETGKVMWFDVSKCYGLITRDKGGDILVSYSSFRDEGACFLIKGCQVQFIVVDTSGGLQVKDLVLID